jgi:hypothetical protein
MNPPTTPEDLMLCEVLTTAVNEFLRKHPDYDPARAVGVAFGNAIGWMKDTGVSAKAILDMCEVTLQVTTHRKNLS